ncbi:ISLre2 family transposase [Lactococcus garvieae]|uniref:Uncharacterized protein family (UPF0236) n=1 Tax=Lactococcus garvieae TaxID=1363 RepID=A0A1I4GJD7_9LACT|nr:ISLre2 family transposase [Lactococcus garvieae]SFL29291.1 Uncharacterised protein family (UPF0236) [Lactococcus garvieae]
MSFDERAIFSEMQEENVKRFLEYIQDLDHRLSTKMKATGWKYAKTAVKTVTFTFGVVTYKRRAYRKGTEWRYPVDEELGLAKRARYSPELLYQLTDYATSMPLRHVSQKFETSHQIYIGKSTVHSTTKKVAQLFEERDEYRYYEEEQKIELIKAAAVYVEGDGVMVKTQSKEKGTDLSHFLVHTGSEKVSENRYRLTNKHEIIASNNHEAREKLEDYLSNHYEFTPETVLITNSDMGRGYTPYVFKQLAELFGCKHEHFWDSKHLNMKIKERFKTLPYELENRLFLAIQKHDKAEVRVIFDTAESLLIDEEQLLKLQKFRRKLLNNFQYTKPAALRGFSHRGIGVMETQHRKITYRMKRRGMYWSERGANTMSRMILALYDHSLRELFFGSWRQEYVHYQVLPERMGSYTQKGRRLTNLERQKKLANQVKYFK